MKGVGGILVLACVAVALGYPAGEDSAASGPAPLSDLIEQVKVGLTNLGKDLSERWEKDSKNTVDTVTQQATNFVNNLEELVKKTSVEIETKSPEIQQAWDAVKSKFTGVVSNINKQIPEAQEQAKELGNKLTQGINVIIEESNKTAEEFKKNSATVQEDIAKFTKQAVELAVKTTQNLESEVKRLAVTEAPAA